MGPNRLSNRECSTLGCQHFAEINREHCCNACRKHEGYHTENCTGSCQARRAASQDMRPGPAFIHRAVRGCFRDIQGKDEKGKGQGQEGRDEQDSVGSSSMSDDTVCCPHCHRTFSLYHSDSSDAGKGSGKDGKGVFEPEAEPSTGGGKCGGKGDGTGDGTGGGKAAANAPTQEKTQCFLVATVSLMIQLNHERQLLEQAHCRQLAKQLAARVPTFKDRKVFSQIDFGGSQCADTDF